jgi:hypothetical protein
MNDPKFVNELAQVDQAATQPFPRSRKVYIGGSRPDIQVPMREISQSDTPAGMGITEIVPECTRPGCALVVRGWGFGTRPSAQTVTLYGQRLRVVRASAYELQLTLPRTAGSGPLIITMRGRPPVQSAQPLTVAP